jgi:hypothetical protein
MNKVTELAIGRDVHCRGAWCGVVTFVVWDPSSDKVTHLVVQPEGRETARLVPVNRVVPAPDRIEFMGTLKDFRGLEGADEERFLRNNERPWSDRSDHVLVPAPHRASSALGW